MPENLRVLGPIEFTSNELESILNRNCLLTAERGNESLGISPARKGTLIICGSGPSLDDHFAETLREFPDADVMALNGAYRHLIDAHGHSAAYMAMLDARAVNVNFLERVERNTTFLFASQVSPDCFALVPKAQTRVFHLNCASARDAFPSEPLYVATAGGTIGGAALVLGAVLGYRHVVLLGFDCSYRDGVSHARPQAQNVGVATMDVYVEDRKYVTTPAMASQVMQFRTFYGGFKRLCPGLEVDLIGSGLFYDFISTGQTSIPTTESEAAKYEEMYAHDDYRMSEQRREEVLRILTDTPRGSLVDIGTGRGETLEIAKSLGHTPAFGTETVPDLIDGYKVIRALLPHLPHATGSFDTVTCFEVIEHLLPHDVLPALQELARVAKSRVIVSVCTIPDIDRKSVV